MMHDPGRWVAAGTLSMEREKMKWITCFCVLVSAAVVTHSLPGQEATDGARLQVVKYDTLKEVIHKNRGKVVLIDFWAYF